MLKIYSTLSFLFIFLISIYGQFEATITITDSGTDQPLENVEVFLNNETLTTNNSGQVVFTDLSDGTYDYTVSLACYEFGFESLMISGTDATDAVEMSPLSTNSVFFFVGSPLTLSGATVSLFNNDGFFETLVTGNFLGDIFENVPYGEYSYTIEASCYETISGTVTVDCADGLGASVAENPVPSTTNSVFFFVGSPLTLSGATVSLFNNDGFFETLVTGNFLGDIFENVPYGEYSYTIEASCYETISGTVTVDCADGGGASVAENPVPSTTNSVFFFVGSPLTLSGATVSLFNNDGFFETLVTGNFLGDIFENVPYGEYSYTIEATCYETISGTVTVDCADGGGASVAENPVPSTTNSVFFFVGSPLTLSGATVSLFNNDGFFETLVTGNFLGDIFENVPYGEYSYTIEATCYETISGTVTVDCADGGGASVAENPVPSTTNSVFFFVGSPLTLSGATVSLFNNDGFFETLVTGNFLGDIFENVPYGEYSYTIEATCYETISGTVTVDCADGGGASVAENPVPSTTNSVFFFVGSPLTLSGATVSLFNNDGFFETLVTGNFLGDIFENVPYGEYSYTIEATCYETISGTVTVDCADGGGASVAENPVEIVLDNTVTENGSTLTAAESGVTYQWIDCDNGNAEIDGATAQSFTATENGNYAVVISSENCTTTSECFTVMLTGINDLSSDIDVTVFPNPFNDNLNIRLESTNGLTQIEVISITGKMVRRANFGAGELISLNLADLASGTYILRIKNDRGQYTGRVNKY